MASDNCKTLHIDSSTKLNEVDEAIDEEIDIINYTDSSTDKMMDDEDQDGPEYSSSFGDTFASDDEMHCNNDVTEVNSSFKLLDGFDKVIRKKKVTAHWREYINPIMWRCLWLELRMKQLLSQIAKYNKQLLAYKKAKGKQSNKIQSECSVSKLVPSISQSYCRGTVKRRKRRRYEENVDVASYMPNHMIFSYYENKRTDVDSHTVDHFDDLDDNTNGNDDKCLLGSDDKSIEEIFLNIEAIQHRVVVLKNHLNTTVYGTGTKKSSPDNLIFGVPLATDAQNANACPRDNDDALPTPPSNHVFECESDDIRSENEASGSEVTDDADVVQNLVRHLTAGLTIEEREALSNEIEENFLIDNPVAQEVYWSFERLYYRTDQHSVAMLTKDESHYGEEKNTTMLEPGSVREDVNAQQHEVLQSYCKPEGNKRVQQPPMSPQGGLKIDSIPSWSMEFNGHSDTPRMSGRLNDPNPLSLHSNDPINTTMTNRSKLSRSKERKRRTHK